MAFTDTEKNNIVYYLGWPAKTLVESSTHYQHVVNDRMINLSDAAETKTRSLLGELKKIDEKLEEARCRLSATKIGDITTNKDEIRMLKTERNRVIRELSRLLDIPTVKTGAYMADVVV